MVEIKGNWLKLLSSREVNALGHKKPASFTKEMFLDVLNQIASSQNGGGLW